MGLESSQQRALHAGTKPRAPKGQHWPPDWSRSLPNSLILKVIISNDQSKNRQQSLAKVTRPRKLRVYASRPADGPTCLHTQNGGDDSTLPFRGASGQEAPKTAG